jgi:hypothetical protein
MKIYMENSMTNKKYYLCYNTKDETQTVYAINKEFDDYKFLNFNINDDNIITSVNNNICYALTASLDSSIFFCNNPNGSLILSKLNNDNWNQKFGFYFGDFRLGKKNVFCCSYTSYDIYFVDYNKKNDIYQVTVLDTCNNEKAARDKGWTFDSFISRDLKRVLREE